MKYSFAQPAGMSDADAREIQRSIRRDKLKAKAKPFKNPCGKFKTRKSVLRPANVERPDRDMMIEKATMLTKLIMTGGASA